MLVLTPTHVLDFEVEAAAADLTAAVKALAAARGVPFPVDRIPTLYLQVLTPPLPANELHVSACAGGGGFCAQLESREQGQERSRRWFAREAGA
jgi:hypothetical protein